MDTIKKGRLLMAKRNRKIVRYKKPLNINIGNIIFGVTFIYLIICVILFFSRDRIRYYEVVAGKSAQANTKKYTGLILREEATTQVKNSGYVHFYIRNCSRASIGTTVYTLDETGVVADLLERAKAEGTTLTDTNLADIKQKISEFEAEYDDTNFSNVYTFKADLENAISECMNLSALENLNTLADDEQKNSFKIYSAKQAGIIVCSTDGYEGLKEQDLTEQHFDKSKYKSVSYHSDDLVEADSPIYKTVTSEMWNMYVPLTKKEVKKYKDTKALSIRILKDDITLTCNFEILELNGKSYGKITLSRYMMNYAAERFLDFTIVEDEIEGLKVPKSAVVEKDFYTIPVSYLTTGANTNKEGFNVEKVSEEGVSYVVFETPSIYKKTEEFAYIDANLYEKGTDIIMPDSQSRYTLSDMESLKGVFNINNGYAVFDRIEILAESNDYYIIEIGTSYGLTIYDHIVLNGASVKEEQIIFQ